MQAMASHSRGLSHSSSDTQATEHPLASLHERCAICTLPGVWPCRVFAWWARGTMWSMQGAAGPSLDVWSAMTFPHSWHIHPSRFPTDCNVMSFV